MFAWTEAAFDAAAIPDEGISSAQQIHSAMLAGTRVATPVGWVAVETLAIGDLVLTFDGGLQPVSAITQHLDTGAQTLDHPQDWPLLVPSGVLGNRVQMLILPRQAVLIESEVAERVMGDPFVLVPALALAGYCGISQRRPGRSMIATTLHFATDQLVFADCGAVLQCPGLNIPKQEVAIGADSYEVLPLDVAQMLVRNMTLEPPVAAAINPHAYRR